MSNLLQFLGRFHPLLVHFPIGILLLAFCFELMAQTRRYKKLRIAVQPTLFWGTLFAVISAATGFVLSQEGGYEEELLSMHQYAGITTAIFSVALYYLRKNSWVLRMEKVKGKPVRILLFIPVVLLLTFTGHLGGSLTHGEDFLTEFATLSPVEDEGIAKKIRSIPDLNEAVLYHDIVQPVLQSKCYSCHSSAKQKGELRLDGPENILKGGKHGDIIISGNADSSRMVARLMLPLEDKHHMPPNEKPQLSSVEIDLLRLWITEGADFEKQIKNFPDVQRINNYVQLLIEIPAQENWIPAEPAPAPSEQAIADLKASGAIVMPLAAESNYLMVSFGNVRSIGARELEKLLPIKDQLVSLKLSFCTLTDQNLGVVAGLNKLVWLYLDHSNITDDNLRNIAELDNLKYLNLVGTKITDAASEHIAKMKSLRQLYLYQSGITPAGINNLLSTSPSIKVDTGHYTLPSLVTDTLVFKRKI
jgi:uncharacterized membrane protein/Leucine-rich repeat (LRR) protein